MRPSLTVVLAAITFLTLAEVSKAQVTSSSKSAAATASMDRKLQHIQSNAKVSQPDQTPTEFTEQEINAYFSSGAIKLPAGLQSVVFQGQPDVVTATARVDFDQLKAGRRSSNPLLSMFSGIHDVVVAAHVRGAGGQGYVNVDTVSLDGVEIPRFALQMFVEKYLQPKYPGVGLDSKFALPDRIDTAKVGLHKLTITQK